MSNDEASGASKAIHKFINDLWDELGLTETRRRRAGRRDAYREEGRDDRLPQIPDGRNRRSSPSTAGADAGIRALRALIEANGGPNPTRGQSQHAWRKSVRKRLPDLDDFDVLDDPW